MILYQDSSITKFKSYNTDDEIIISTCDCERVFKHNWSVYANGVGLVVRCTTIIRYNYLGSFILMHKNTDHQDRNPLNNVRENLRKVSTSIQAQNRRTPDNNTSGIKGVCLHNGKWVARVARNHNRIYLGGYKTKEEAEKAIKNFQKSKGGQAL